MASLAVPGGRTAAAVLPVLAGRDLPWRRIAVTLADERCVPADHADSNEGLVRRLLAGPAATADLAGLYRPDETPAAAARRLETLRPFAAVLLGMGEDGHIASLFPGDAANAEPAPLAAVSRPDHPRLTWTPSVLAAADTLVLAFTGAAKAAVLEQALAEGPAAALPVRHALGAGATVLIGP